MVTFIIMIIIIILIGIFSGVIFLMIIEADYPNLSPLKVRIGIFSSFITLLSSQEK